MLLRVLAIGNGVVERESRRGKEVPCSKAKEKGSPRVNPDPRRKEVTIVGKSRANAIDAEQRDIGPVDAAPPNTSLTFTNKARIKVNLSPTSSLSLKLRSATTYLLAQMMKTSTWTEVRTFSMT
jgi:hypothetical protein